MIGEEILESKSITLAEIAELLKERKKEKELSYEQEHALKYAKAFSKISVQKTSL